MSLSVHPHVSSRLTIQAGLEHPDVYVVRGIAPLEIVDRSSAALAQYLRKKDTAC